ncbi:MAG: type III-E CRISPR-associated TPR-CHAT protein Csx29 [Nitrospirota bacterium]
MCEIEGIVNRLQEAAKNPNEKEKLAEAYLDYLEAKENCKDTPLHQFGLPPNKELCETLTIIQKEKIWEDAIRKKAEEYLKAFDKKGISHAKRRKDIESALGLLKGLYETPSKELKPKTLTVYAKAYLLRSKIFRPKGVTVPAKKIEAIEKGIKLADDAIERATELTSAPKVHEEAWRIKAQLYLERDRLEDEENILFLKELIKVLETALINGCNQFEKPKEDIKIAVRYSELTNNKECPEQIINNFKIPSIEIELEKAKAYGVLGDYNNLKEKMFTVIKILKHKLFSDPIWDDTVSFLKRLMVCGVPCWKKLSLKAWGACQKVERKTTTPLHIRWYWSRQRDLYDLAFLAAEEIFKLKARIADSLKSRPALQWSVWDSLSREDKKYAECYKRILEMEANFQTGGFIKGFDKIKRKCGKKIRRKKQRPFTKIPEGWIVVHFYVNQLEKQGYALIYDNTRVENDKWKQEKFEYNKLFDAYVEWQTNYNRYKKGSARLLVELCKTIGKDNVMGFLFNDKIIPSEKSVLFIPHDFLHRLPLHGAISEKNEFFMTKNTSCYLPAWAFARDIKTSFSTNGKYLIVNSKDFKENKDYTPSLYTTTFKDFEAICTLPQFLAVICHGRTDTVNPFNAKLLLEDKNITHLDILNLNCMLDGAKVYLGVCETDLVPSLSDIIDEHLSISTSFINKGASEILGTMWRVSTSLAKVILEDRCLNSIKSFAETLWDYIQSRNDISPETYMNFYYIVAFRVIGNPDFFKVKC